MQQFFRPGLLAIWVFLFFAGATVVNSAENQSIVIIAVGAVDRQVLAELNEGLVRAFGVEVTIGQRLPEPDYALDQKRGQYSSTAILARVRRERGVPVSGKVLAVVDHDLFVPDLNFVFGEASQTVAVLSVTRLRQEFYGRPEDRRLFFQRTLTEAVHELGHSFGLAHCTNPQCVMFFSNRLSDTDRKGFKFCVKCRQRLDSFMVTGQGVS